MGQAISAESRKKIRSQRKKQKKKGWKRYLLILSRISGLTRSLFGSICTTQKVLNCEMAKFCSENHEHIVCEYAKDKFVPIVSFLGGKELLKSYVVPGKASKTEIKVTERILSRFVIGIFLRIELLHSEGKSLNGCFAADSIYVPDEDFAIAPHMDVKFGNLPFDAFQQYTEKGGNLDLMRVGWIIENVILSSETELSSELKKLLELLRSDPVSKKGLIYSHVSLKGLKEKLSYYVRMYKRLLYLKKKNRDKYNNIMQKISSDDHWRKRASKNKFLDQFHPRTRYSKDGEGESRFFRNSVAHLPDILLAQEDGSLQAPPQKGPQPPSQRNGAISIPQRNGTHPAANKAETQLAPNKPTTHRSGAQQYLNQPVSQMNGGEPAEHMKGAQQEAQTKGTQLASRGEEEEQLEDYHAAIVLLEAFPEFLGDLQEAIHEENELESCNADGPVAHGKNTVFRSHS